jgi:hypothetical protein
MCAAQLENMSATPLEEFQLRHNFEQDALILRCKEITKKSIQINRTNLQL